MGLKMYVACVVMVGRQEGSYRLHLQYAGEPEVFASEDEAVRDSILAIRAGDGRYPITMVFSCAPWRQPELRSMIGLVTYEVLEDSHCLKADVQLIAEQLAAELEALGIFDPKER